METTTMKITPYKALEILKINTRNRPLKKNIVEFYSDQMKRGLWKENGESIVISEKNVLLDGQHRLAAIVKSQTTQQFVLVQGVSDDVFATIDTGIVRTGSDMLAIEGVKYSSNISSIITNYISLVKGYVRSKNRDLKLSKQEIVQIYFENKDLFDSVVVLAVKCNQKLNILSATHIGGMMVYLIKDKKHNESKVYDFFKQLHLNENVENQTIIVLRDKLLKVALSKYEMTPKYKQAIIRKTWNCFITGKELKILTYNVESELMPNYL